MGARSNGLALKLALLGIIRQLELGDQRGVVGFGAGVGQLVGQAFVVDLEVVSMPPHGGRWLALPTAT